MAPGRSASTGRDESGRDKSGPGRAAVLPLALTMGDPAGIGPDITLKAWTGRRQRALPPFVVYADPAVLSARAAALGLDIAVRTVGQPAEAFVCFDHALPVIAIAAAGSVEARRPQPGSAASTLASIDAATAAVLNGEAAAVVTNPIAKSILYDEGFRHPGHTEYLAHLASLATGRTIVPVMMLVSEQLRVVPATIHIALADVPRALSAEALEQTIRITAEGLTRDFGLARPRLAISGLNPHAGENGAMGHEERTVIEPVIARLRAMGLDVSGPHPADTMFHANARARYDVAIAMYHDQALIPIKTLAFDSGVNVTLGLPFVRTSPDHGTAFDIAGTGAASEESLIQAILLAGRMANLRTQGPA